jgi:hypothetical protein
MKGSGSCLMQQLRFATQSGQWQSLSIKTHLNTQGDSTRQSTTSDSQIIPTMTSIVKYKPS